MKLFSKKLVKTGRKYPIKYDESGLSVRKRAFRLFQRGSRPARVAKELDVKLTTICRYFYDFKKLSPGMEGRYYVAKTAKKGRKDYLIDISKALAVRVSVPEEKILERLQKPWALRDLVIGKVESEFNQKAVTSNERQAKAEEKRVAEVLDKCVFR